MHNQYFDCYSYFTIFCTLLDKFVFFVGRFRHVESKQMDLVENIKTTIQNDKFQPEKECVRVKPKRIVKQSDVEELSQSDKAEKTDITFDKMKLIKENLHLLSEIDKLKKTNSSLSQRIYYLDSLKKA